MQSAQVRIIFDGASYGEGADSEGGVGGSCYEYSFQSWFQPFSASKMNVLLHHYRLFDVYQYLKHDTVTNLMHTSCSTEEMHARYTSLKIEI